MARRDADGLPGRRAGGTGIYTETPGWLGYIRDDILPSYMDVSKNSGFSPKSLILIGFGTIINHPFWGTTIFGNTDIGIIISYYKDP